LPVISRNTSPAKWSGDRRQAGRNGKLTCIPAQGDLIWLNFTPQAGHEQMGKRPALVISNDFFNKQTGLAVVCPVTFTRRNYPLHVKVGSTGKITGCVMVEQLI